MVRATRRMDGARGGDPGGNLRRALRRGGQGKVGRLHRRHIDMEIDAVEQRP